MNKLNKKVEERWIDFTNNFPTKAQVIEQKYNSWDFTEYFKERFAQELNKRDKEWECVYLIISTKLDNINKMKKKMIRILAMSIIGVSAGLIPTIGFWFLIPWVIGWIIYDFNLTNKRR